MAYKNLKILITEPSVIVRSGLGASLKRLSNYHVQISENNSYELSLNFIKTQKPDLLVLNPIYWGIQDLRKLRSETNCPILKCMAVVSAPVAENLLVQYDGVIFLHDSIEIIAKKIDKMFDNQTSPQVREMSDVLSFREKEILVCVVKGMTNKEIGKKLFLSTHTIISHRRNISRKLEIHSTAGLTVYAIMNKLVELDEINNLMDSE